MKAQITITGQIHGNFVLLRNLPCVDGYHEGMFNSFHLDYPTVRDAKKAIKDAYKNIKNDLDNWEGSLEKSRENDWLRYDASTAKINKIRET